MNGPLLLTIAEAAEKLFGEYTPSTRDRVYRFIDQGHIKSVRDGRRHWISQHEIDRVGAAKKEGTD